MTSATAGAGLPTPAAEVYRTGIRISLADDERVRQVARHTSGGRGAETYITQAPRQEDMRDAGSDRRSWPLFNERKATSADSYVTDMSQAIACASHGVRIGTLVVSHRSQRPSASWASIAEGVHYNHKHMQSKTYRYTNHDELFYATRNALREKVHNSASRGAA